MSSMFSFIKGLTGQVTGALNYGLTHLDQFSTAGDVIVVQHADGTLHSTPFNVRFGKISVPRSSNKIVQIQVNGQLISAVMKLRPDGTAYFVESTMGYLTGANGTPLVSPPRSPNVATPMPGSLSAGSEELRVSDGAAPPLLSLGTTAAAAAASASSSSSLSGGAAGAGADNGGRDSASSPSDSTNKKALVIDEGSAVELAKKNPEIRDLVTSIIGESRNEAGGSDASGSSNNNNNNNNQGGGDGSGANTAAGGGGSNIHINTNSNDSSQDDDGGVSGGVGARTHQRIRSRSGIEGLRLSKFASSDNLAAFNNLMANDDSFAAIMKEMPAASRAAAGAATPPSEQAPLTLAASGDSLNNTYGSSASLHAAASPRVDNDDNNNSNTNNNNNDDNDLGSSPTMRPLTEGFSPTTEQPPQQKTQEQQQQQQQEQQQQPPQQQEQLQTQQAPPLQSPAIVSPRMAPMAAAVVPVAAVLPSSGSMVLDDEFIDDSSGDEEYVAIPISRQVIGVPGASGLAATAMSGDGSSAGSGGLRSLSGSGSGLGASLDHAPPPPHGPASPVALTAADNLALDATARAHQRPIMHATITPGHNELVKFNLKDGANTVKFIVYSTTLTRSTEVEARIFLWPYTAKVIVSDIDGTVTKSDVMGHLSALFRWDWTHPGLCDLYTGIAKNGYQFLYLTARSLCQTSSTRTFLEDIVQDGQRLPDGPVFTASEKLFAALTQELLKRSHIFKTNCLSEVKSAFPKSLREPLYAGFGNRIGDSIAYESVGIPLHKIFIIDESSVVHVCKVKRTYRDLAHLVDVTFPPISGKVPQLASQLAVGYREVAIVNGVATHIDGGGGAAAAGEAAALLQELVGAATFDETNPQLEQLQQQLLQPAAEVARSSSLTPQQQQQFQHVVGYTTPTIGASSSSSTSGMSSVDSSPAALAAAATTTVSPLKNNQAAGPPSSFVATPVFRDPFNNSASNIASFGTGANSGYSSSSHTVSPHTMSTAGSSSGLFPIAVVANNNNSNNNNTAGTSLLYNGIMISSNSNVLLAGGGGEHSAGSRSRSPSDTDRDGGGASSSSAVSSLNATTTTTAGASAVSSSRHEESLEERVDFNDFNFWRVDPQSQVSLTRGGGKVSLNTSSEKISTAASFPAVPAAAATAAGAATGAATATMGAQPQQQQASTATMPVVEQKQSWVGWMLGRK